MAILPEQIKRQVAEADAVLASMQADAVEGITADGTSAPVQGTEATPSNNVTSVQTTTTPDDPNSETYAQRWRSLQGVYNATVRRADALDGRVKQLEQILATLQPQQGTQPTPQPTSTRYVTEKDITDYGDSIDMMRRVAREELAPVMAQLNTTISTMGKNVSQQVQHVAQRQALTQEEIFYSKLKEMVPNWEQINASPDFQQWLSEIDPQTGIQRQIYLDAAHRDLDANRVVYFFRAAAERFQQQTVTSPSSSQTVTTPPSSQLELQVSPGRTRVTNPPVGNGQAKVWTRSGISKFYDEVRRGLYRGKEAEMGQIERDIIAAGRENRVVAG